MSDAGAEEKSEDPSQRKLKKARESGNIERSQDFALVFSTIGAALATWIAFDHTGRQLVATTERLLELDKVPVAEILTSIRDTLVLFSLPPIIGGTIASLLGNFLANRGFVLAMERIKPEWGVMSLSSYLRRTFSKKGLFHLLKILMFVILLIALFHMVSRYFAQDFFKVLSCGMDCGAGLFPYVALSFLIPGLMIALVMAVVDIKLQSHLYLQEQRSTKSEAKREQKEDMGEPTLRKERRKQHQAFSGPTTEEVIATSSAIIYDRHRAVAVISVTTVGGERQYYLVQAAVADATQPILDIASGLSKPIVESTGLAFRLARQGINSRIVDPALVRDLEFLLKSRLQHPG